MHRPSSAAKKLRSNCVLRADYIYIYTHTRTHTHAQAEQRRKEAEEKVRVESRLRREAEERAQQMETSLRDQLNQSGPTGKHICI